MRERDRERETERERNREREREVTKLYQNTSALEKNKKVSENGLYAFWITRQNDPSLLYTKEKERSWGERK